MEKKYISATFHNKNDDITVKRSWSNDGSRDSWLAILSAWWRPKESHSKAERPQSTKLTAGTRIVTRHQE